MAALPWLHGGITPSTAPGPLYEPVSARPSNSHGDTMGAYPARNETREERVGRQILRGVGREARVRVRPGRNSHPRSEWMVRQYMCPRAILVCQTVMPGQMRHSLQHFEARMCRRELRAGRRSGARAARPNPFRVRRLAVYFLLLTLASDCKDYQFTSDHLAPGSSSTTAVPTERTLLRYSSGRRWLTCKCKSNNVAAETRTGPDIMGEAAFVLTSCIAPGAVGLRRAQEHESPLLRARALAVVRARCGPGPLLDDVVARRRPRRTHSRRRSLRRRERLRAELRLSENVSATPGICRTRDSAGG